MANLPPAPLHAYTLFEVLELGGPIVAFDEPCSIVVTVNKTCFSAWISLGNGCFVGTNTCLVADVPKVGDCTDFGLVQEVAYEWLKELAEGCNEDEPSND